MDLLKAPIVATATLICLCFVLAQCGAASASLSPEQEQEIQMLRSKVASLEDEISRRKEDTSQLESVVRGRTAQMAALVGELEFLQVRGLEDTRLSQAPKVNLDDDGSVMKANTHSAMLEEQIERLGNDLEDQIKKGESLEAQATEAERSLQECGRKLQCAEKTNVEQRKKIEDLSDRLQHAQDKLSELVNEAKMKDAELAQVHGTWLPHWLAVLALRCQELASDKWQVHWKPAVDPLMQKVAEKSAYAQGLVEPHLQKAQHKFVPVAKSHLNALRNTTVAFTSAVANSTTTAYIACRDVIRANTANAGELADNYWQESKRFSQPYVSGIVAASERHMARASEVLELCMRPAASAWRSLVSFMSEHHRQVQNGVKRVLEGNQLLTHLSADKLAWITASALFVLPVLSMYKIVSATVRYAVGKTRRGRTGLRAASRK